MHYHNVGALEAGEVPALVKLSQLELLVSIADRGSISAAADFFGLTQPTVSHQIQQLEEELGVELVRRKSRGMALTDAGELVVSEARSVVQQVRAIVIKVKERVEVVEGSVVLGLSPVSPVSTHHFPFIYPEFHQSYPHVAVSVIEEGSLELVLKLRDGLVDLAIMSLPILGSHINITPLWREPLVLIDSTERHHPELVGLDYFRDDPWVLFHTGFALRSTVNALCQSSGFDPRPAAEGSSVSAIIGFVAAGLGVSIAPREAVWEHERSGRIQIVTINPPMSRTMALVTASETSLSPATRAMADAIVTYGRKLQQPLNPSP